MGNRTSKIVVFLILFLLFVPAVVYGDGLEQGTEGYYTVYEKNTDKEIFATSWEVIVGDRYLSTDNKLYEVVNVDRDNKKGFAKFLRDVELPEVDEIFVEETMQTAQKQKKVAIYFSHTDESYVPTDGTHSIPGNGGIFNVGDAFKRGFEKNGVEAIVDKTPHDPHDANAYVRSRRTALKLLKQRPDAIFDVHRDAIPKKYYVDEIDGTPVSKVRIVLGRRNQNLRANEQLALKIKAVGDKMYPGFMRDIYYARGSYNQSLTPRALLFEFGTHKLSRERAEKSAEILAGVVTKALYGGKTPAGTRVRAEQPQSSGAGSGILWMVALGGLGALGYLFLSTGGKEMRSKIKGFARKEFGSFLARRNRNKK